MYPCIAVEHSYNCMVLLCSLFFWPSGHYTKIACGELDLSAYGITSGQAVRINNVVIITFWHNAAVPTGKAINTVALPDDFRPQANKVGTAVYMDSSSTIALGTSIVKPDGHIYLDSAITRVRIEATIAYTIK